MGDVDKRNGSLTSEGNVIHGASVNNVDNVRREDTVITEEIKEFDDIFNYVGGWGPFQYIITLGFFPFNFFLGYIYLSPILTVFPPPHWCKVPALEYLEVDQRKELAIPRETNGDFSKCSQYLVDWTQYSNSSLPLEPGQWEVGACTHGWEFDTDNYHRSIVSDLDWVCEQGWIAATSQSIFFFGSIPGMLFFGWLSDHYGRLPTILLSNLLCLVSGLLTPFVTGHISFFLLRFVSGLGFNTFFTVPYTLAIEYVEESKRTFVGNLGLALCLTLSGIFQPWLIKWLGDWKTFNWILYSQMVLVVVTPWVMPESGRWLMSMGEGKKTVAVVEKIARLNGKQVPSSVSTSILKLCEQNKQTTGSIKAPTYLDLFRTKSMRRITILLTIIWMLISLEFDATVRNITNLNFSIYWSFMVSTSLEFPADILAIVGLEKLGRRWSAALSMFGVGVFLLPCAWLQDDPMPQAVLAMFGRFFATYAMNTGFQFSVEVLPTQLRGQGMALVNVISMVAQMASPMVVYSSELSDKAPWLIISLIAFLTIIPGLYLPETAGINLPQTLEDMDTFGKNMNFFWIPLMGEQSRYKKTEEQRKNTVYHMKELEESGAQRDNPAFIEI